MARERKVVLEMHIPAVKAARKRLVLPDAIPAVEVSITPTKDSENMASKIVDNFWTIILGIIIPALILGKWMFAYFHAS
jgi:hypothetical protein